MKVYIVYKDILIGGAYEDTLRVFKHKKDAVSYSSELKDSKYYPDYFDVNILEQNVI